VRRAPSFWVVAALTAAVFVTLSQALQVSYDADHRNIGFYAGLLYAAIAFAPIMCVLHALMAVRRRRAAAEQEALATQMAGFVAAAITSSRPSDTYDAEDETSGLLEGGHASLEVLQLVPLSSLVRQLMDGPSMGGHRGGAPRTIAGGVESDHGHSAPGAGTTEGVASTV
jgi:hypothetical protein